MFIKDKKTPLKKGDIFSIGFYKTKEYQYCLLTAFRPEENSHLFFEDGSIKKTLFDKNICPYLFKDPEAYKQIAYAISLCISSVDGLNLSFQPQREEPDATFFSFVLI